MVENGRQITLLSVPARTQLRPLIPVGWTQPGLPGGKFLFGDSGAIEGIFVCEVLKEIIQIQKHPRIKNTLARSPANVCVHRQLSAALLPVRTLRISPRHQTPQPSSSNQVVGVFVSSESQGPAWAWLEVAWA
jgi:hypothetical protein